MTFDLREHTGGPVEADVCIVGGGTVGLALAHELAGSGRDVLVLESGGTEPHAGLDELNATIDVGTLPLDARSSRMRALGGASRLWAGQCVPMDPEDYEARPWVPGSGWPVREDELAPAYRRAERLMDISGETYDERTWARFRLSAPSLDVSRVRTRVTVLAPQLDMARITAPALAAASNVRVATNATVAGLELDEDARSVTGVRVRSHDGSDRVVQAREVVLAAGAIENARLLLLPHNRSDDGFARGADAVGRYLQDHPNADVATVTGDAWSHLQDRYALLYRRGRRYYPRMVLGAAVQEREQVMNCAAAFVFEHAAGSATARAKSIVRDIRSTGPRPAHVRAGLRVAPGLAAVARRRYLRGLSPGERPEHIRLRAFVEQPPARESRVSLAVRRDALGVPLPQVDWRVDDRAVRTARALVEAADAELGRLGLGRAIAEPWLDAGTLEGFRDQFHHIGTTRMGTDPATSVVDPDGRVHGTRNLYVAGSSVFPTSGWANPTLTALALALRLGERLRGGDHGG